MEFKYKMKVEITLQSNNLPKLQKLASKYFLKKIPQKYNNFEDIENYVSIDKTKEVLK